MNQDPTTSWRSAAKAVRALGVILLVALVCGASFLPWLSFPEATGSDHHLYAWNLTDAKDSPPIEPAYGLCALLLIIAILTALGAVIQTSRNTLRNVAVCAILLYLAEVYLQVTLNRAIAIGDLYGSAGPGSTGLGFTVCLFDTVAVIVWALSGRLALAIYRPIQQGLHSP